MTLSRPVHRWLTLAIFAALALGLAGCSKSTKPKVGFIPSAIPHADADDIAQYIGASMASDNGGWYYTVRAMCDSLAQPPLLDSGVPDTTTFALSSPTAPPLVYTFELAYYRSNQVGYPVRDTASKEIEADLEMAGGQLNSPVGAANYDVTSTYGVSADWSIYVYGLSPEYNAVQFDGFFDDSAFASVNTTVDTAATNYRYWYHVNSVYVDTMTIRKSDLVSNPYPVDGDVQFIIDAYNMKRLAPRTPSGPVNSADTDHEVLCEAEMKFNGTATATLSIVDIIDDASWEYRYSVNLKTGAIARLN